MKIKGVGVLRHHFHGEYWATIAIQFKNNEEARLAFRSGKLENWEIGRNKRFLIWEGGKKELNKCIDVLVSFGAERSKITSLKYSVDYGEDFNIELDIGCPEQLKLFGE